MFYSHVLDGLILAESADFFITFEYRGTSLRLPCLAVQEYKSLPKFCKGLYFVVQNKEIIYVGASSNIKQRWYSHPVIKKLDCGDMKIAWFPVDDGELMYYFESKLINYFKPRLNVQSNYKEQVIKVIDADHPRFAPGRFNDFWSD